MPSGSCGVAFSRLGEPVMTAEPESMVQLDTTGLLCPLPVLKARKRLQSMNPGQILEMRADDPAALVDVPHFCTEQGHELLSEDTTPEGALLFRIRKQG